MLYTFDRPNRPAKLLDELLAAIPALRPVPGVDGLPQAVLRLWADGDTIYIDVNDGVDVTEAQLAAVVNAHTNTAPPPTQFEQDLQAVRDLLRAPGNPTATQVKQILKVFGKQLAILSRDD